MNYLLSKAPRGAPRVTEVGEGGEARPQAQDCQLTCLGYCRYSCGGCWTDSCVGHCSSFCGRVSW